MRALLLAAVLIAICGPALAEPQHPTVYPVPLGFPYVSVAATEYPIPEELILAYENRTGWVAPYYSYTGFVATTELITSVAGEGCALGYYEFDVIGRVLPELVGGPYSLRFALYTACSGGSLQYDDPSMIPGTAGEISLSEDGPRTIVFVPDPDTRVELPRKFLLGIEFSRSNAAAIVGTGAELGTAPSPATRCGWHFPFEGFRVYANTNFRLFVRDDCEMAAPEPLGACCDMWITRCAGGANNDGRCMGDEHCPGGSCERSCRQTPRENCPPREGERGAPDWIEGAACVPDLFAPTCGVAACCTPYNYCVDLTEDECDGLPSAEVPRSWKAHELCSSSAVCWNNSWCEDNDRDCRFVHGGIGCRHQQCCSLVCSLDSWCCLVDWDRECVSLAEERCTVAPEHHTCATALPVEAGYPQHFIAESPPRVLPTCIGRCGADATDEYCLDETDCEGMACTPIELPVYNQAWFRFVATHTTARLSTCQFDNQVPAVLRVFAAGPGGECSGMELIACADSRGCWNGAGVCTCVDGLTPGETYFVALGAPEASVEPRELTVSAPCSSEHCGEPNDCNWNDQDDYWDLVRGEGDDCNLNLVLDECEPWQDGHVDCDWNGVLDECEAEPPRWDSNVDGDVDLLDFARMQHCFTGPGGSLAANDCCGIFNAAGDGGTVDALDYAAFVVAISGP